MVKCFKRYKKIIPFLFYFLFILLLHILSYEKFGDDLDYETVLSSGGISLTDIMSWLKHRYNNWSSRLIIECILIFIVQRSWLWVLVDSSLYVLIAYCLSLFFNINRKTYIDWIIVFVLLTIPYTIMNSAGWIATTTNYMWPLAMGMFALLPSVNQIRHKKNSIILYVLSIFALFYATNQEQMVCIMGAFLVIFNLYYIYTEKRVSKFMLFELVISFASLIFILTCPGNALRLVKEVTTWFPVFAKLSFLRKLEIGYSSSLFKFVMTPNITYAVFTFVLFVCCVSKQRNKFVGVISAVPFISSLVFGMLQDIFVQIWPMVRLSNTLTETGTNFDITHISSCIPLLFITFIACCVLISLGFCFEDKKKAVFSCLILAIGFISRVMMGFSPTIWASGDRTFLFMYMSIVALTIMLLSEHKKIGTFFEKNTLFCCSMSSFYMLSLLNQLACYFMGY